MAAKTNALRLLDQMGIAYETREYEVDPADLSAETVAAKVGLPPEQVFKTLAVQGDRSGKQVPHLAFSRIGGRSWNCRIRSHRPAMMW